MADLQYRCSNLSVHVCPLASDSKAWTHVCVYVCILEYTSMYTRAMRKSNTCALLKLMQITLTRSAWLFFFTSVTTCSFYFATSKSRIISSCECDRDSQVHCVCMCEYSRACVFAYSRVTRERFASAVKLLMNGTVHKLYMIVDWVGVT